MVTYHPSFAPFVAAPVLVLTPMCYIAGAAVLVRYMRARPAYRLGVTKQVYNLAQVAVSVLLACMFARHWSVWNPLMLNIQFSADIEYWMFANYAGKYFDLGETVIIALRKREEQMTLLHLYHHSSILLIIGWLLHIGYANGTAAFGALANSWVHALMYSHLYSEGGSRCMVAGVNRYTVTFLQLLQFFLVIVHAVLAVLFEQHIPAWVCMIQLAYGVSLVVLFLSIARYGRRARIGRDKLLQERDRLMGHAPRHDPGSPAPSRPPPGPVDAGDVDVGDHYTAQRVQRLNSMDSLGDWEADGNGWEWD